MIEPKPIHSETPPWQVEIDRLRAEMESIKDRAWTYLHERDAAQEGLRLYRAKRSVDGGGGGIIYEGVSARRWEAFRHLEADKAIEEWERANTEKRG